MDNKQLDNQDITSKATVSTGDNGLPILDVQFDDNIKGYNNNQGEQDDKYTIARGLESESEMELLAEQRQVKAAELSPFRLMLKRFFKSKLSLIGVGMLVFLLLFSFLGPVVYTRWGETERDRSPGIVDIESQIIIYIDDDGVEHTIYVVKETPRNENYWAAPSWKHLLGTDRDAMDLFVRLMYGGRISLAIALVVIIVQTLIGVILGGLAGYFGKWVDQLIMRIVEIFICVPSLPLLIIVGAIVADPASGIPKGSEIYVLMAVMIFFGWANIARIVRGQILSLREQDYMVAADAMGFGSLRRIFKHLVPNIMPVLIVTMTLGFGSIILSEAALSFLGLGVPQPSASWGGILSTLINSQNGLTQTLSARPLLWIMPGLFILIAVLSFNFIGDGLRDAMDPRAKR